MKEDLTCRDWWKWKFVFSIDDMTTTSMWLDCWFLDGQQLCDMVPFRVLPSTGLLWNPKVIEIIEEDTWAFPSGSLELQLI